MCSVRTPTGSRGAATQRFNQPPHARRQCSMMDAGRTRCSWDWWDRTNSGVYKSKFHSRKYQSGIWICRQTVQITVEWKLLAITFYFFSFRATENLHIDKAINSHNKNTPQVAKASSQIPGEEAPDLILFHRTAPLQACRVGIHSLWEDQLLTNCLLYR